MDREASQANDGDEPLSWFAALQLALCATIWAWMITAPVVMILSFAIGSLFAIRIVHDWVVVLLVFLSLLPGLGIGYLTGFGARRLQLEAYRKRNGLCLQCGYDLRATEGRCPECGRRATSS